MIDAVSSFDRYTRSARLLPVLLTALPIVFAFFAWFPVSRETPWTAPIGVVAYFGLAGFVAQIARDPGKRKEPVLWNSWGGAPTVQMLRHRDTTFNAVTRDACHRKLRRLMRRVKLPTPEEEAAEPAAADRVYEACVTHLRGATGDRVKFDLIFAENINYGYRRNLWGMRGAGIVLAVVGTMACVTRVAVEWVDSGGVNPLPTALALLDGLLLAWWMLRIRPHWVRTAADAYARRLLEACARL